VEDFGEIVFEQGPDRRGDMPEVEADHTVLVEPFSSDSVNTIVIFVKLVIAQFVEDKEHDQNAAGHSYG
jgi:hypothetical protein